MTKSKLFGLGMFSLGLFLWGCASSSIDNDQDSIPDAVEQELLARYRPYYLFNSDDNFRPISASEYVALSALVPSGSEGDTEILSGEQLQGDPQLVLSASRDGDEFCSGVAPTRSCISDLTKNARQTAFHINPLENPPGPAGGDPGRHGASELDVTTKRNVGLYGHVVPIHLDMTDPNLLCAHRWSDVPRKNEDPLSLYYKVEYWQFFGFSSEDSILNIGDHEGDWTSVQLLIRPARGNEPEKIVRVSHFLHGAELSFDLERPGVTPLPPAPVGLDQFVEYRGQNYGTDGFASVDINDKWFYFRCDPNGDMNRANDNTLRFYRDPDTGLFSHPIVYIERGAHEFWPTEHGRVNTIVVGVAYHSASHDGDGISFLTSPPINLGEVEYPLSMQGDTPLVLRFNGLWGTYSVRTDPPPGPPLHGNWTWPDSSSIGWLLVKSPYMPPDYVPPY